MQPFITTDIVEQIARQRREHLLAAAERRRLFRSVDRTSPHAT